MPTGERQTLSAKDVGTVTVGEAKEPIPGDLTPDEVAYVRTKLAGIDDLERVRDLREKEVALPFVKGGRPAALAAYDARIKELEAPKEG